MESFILKLRSAGRPDRACAGIQRPRSGGPAGSQNGFGAGNCEFSPRLDPREEKLFIFISPPGSPPPIFCNLPRH